MDLTHRTPALFLDRDGVINEEVDYLYRAEDCRLMPGIAQLMRAARQQGYFICVVTNQAGIGRGLYTEAEFHTLMAHMSQELSLQGASWDAVYFSPYHPVHGMGEYRRESVCRKPQPGMLLQAAAEHHLDLERSILIGDRCSDLLAGHAAGVPTLYLIGNTERAPCMVNFSYSYINSLAEAEFAPNATFDPKLGHA